MKLKQQSAKATSPQSRLIICICFKGKIRYVMLDRQIINAHLPFLSRTKIKSKIYLEFDCPYVYLFMNKNQKKKS
jgi:hypothetical protein